LAVGLRKALKTLNQDCRCPRRDPNRGPPKEVNLFFVVIIVITIINFFLPQSPFSSFANALLVCSLAWLSLWT
jgi:hypothetical protein